VRPEESSGDNDCHIEIMENLAIPVFEWPDGIHERRQLADQLVHAIKALPAEQAEVFLLHQEAELSLDEIAAVIGLGRETIKSRLRYAVAKLRCSLSDLRS